jgi:hypothetical protein
MAGTKHAQGALGGLERHRLNILEDKALGEADAIC